MLFRSAPDTELRQAFMARARKCGLVADVHAVSGHGEADVMHALSWALAGRDPWDPKEFQDDR